MEPIDFIFTVLVFLIILLVWASLEAEDRPRKKRKARWPTHFGPRGL